MATKAEVIAMWDKNIITVQELKDATTIDGTIEKLSEQEFYERVLIPRPEMYDYGEKILTLDKRGLAKWQEEHPNLMKKLRKQYQEYMTNRKAELNSQDIPDIEPDIAEDEI